MKDRIKFVRTNAGLSQEDFAKDLKLSRNFISLMENGARTPSERTIDDICARFHVRKEWLVSGVGEMEDSAGGMEWLIARLMDIGADDQRFKWCEALANMTDEEVAQFDKILNLLTNR